MRIAILKYGVILLFFAFLFFSLGFYFKLESKAENEVFSCRQKLTLMKSKVAASHLYIHEYVINTESIDEQSILTPLQESNALLKEMLGIANDRNDSAYIHRLNNIQQTFNVHYKLTLELISLYNADQVISMVSSDYNRVFNLLDTQIDNYFNEIDTRLKEIKYGQKHSRNGLFFFTSLIGVIVILMLVYGDKRTRKTMHELKEGRSEIAQILNTAPIGIFHFDLNYTITDCNPKFEEIIGVSEKVLIGLKMDTDLNDTKLVEAMRDCFVNGRGYYNDVYESVNTTKKTPVEVDFRPLLDKDGNYYSGIGLVRDLTQENIAKEELKNSEEKFRSISDMANDMIIIMNDRGLIEYWNVAAEKVLGYSAEEAMGKHLHDLLAPVRYHEAHHKAFPHWVMTGEGGAIGKTLELEALHKDGHEVTIELSLSSIFMSNSWHAVGIIRDISERKLYERDLIEAKEKAEESDRLKTAFLSNISHEIRTPMNGIIGFSDLLKDPNVTGEQLRYFIDIIKSSSKRMLNVINDIIVISKIDAGDVSIINSRINIEETLADHVSEVKKEADAKGLEMKLKSKLDDNFKYLVTDFEKLHHLLNILFNNAVKFTHEGEIICEAMHHEGHLYISISDTGIGIPKDKQEIIFARFMQADNSKNRAYDGTGLGLSICKAYAKVLGGNLTLQSKVGKGSTFTVSLPQIEEQPIMQAKPKATQKHKTTILVAEDEYPSFILLQEYLSYLDAKIVHAEDGVEALSYVKNHPVDLILMDLKMPNMDGYTAISLIKKEYPHIPIIAQTAYAMSGDEERAIEIGSDDYIRKPINDKILKVKIRRYLK